jgi:uncharacterized membrane protein YfcA
LRSALLSLDRFYAWHSRRVWGWSVLVLLVLTALVLQGRGGWWPVPGVVPLAVGTLVAVFFGALVCEYLDSSLGMGYGTTLTPLLLLAGFAPLEVVQAVLLSEWLTGMAAGLLHQRDGNVDFVRDRRAWRTLLLLAALSALGAVTAVSLALRLPRELLTLAIGLIVLAMGLLILTRLRRPLAYRPRNVLLIGLVAAFNKGLSGGGYGPLVTSGQVLSGLPARHAVAITSVAESFTCLVGLAAFLLQGGRLNPALTLPLVLGALLSVPMATLTVRALPESVLRGAVGVFSLVLGLVALAKLVG